MWEYNKTENMYCPESYHNPDELYHYGVLGMRWRHRKNASVQAANAQYRKYKKEARMANIKRFFSPRTYIGGVNSEKQALEKKINNLENKREKAAFKLVNAAAKDAYNKKLSKTGDKSKATKASMKVYYKGFKQGKYDSGRVGSGLDAGGGQQRYYNNMVKTKGKKFAEAVEKKYNKRSMIGLVGGIITKRDSGERYNKVLNANGNKLIQKYIDRREKKYQERRKKKIRRRVIAGTLAGTTGYYLWKNRDKLR